MVSNSDQHRQMLCACGGDLALCQRLILSAELRRLDAAIDHFELQHEWLRTDLAAQLAHSASRLLTLRAERVELAQRIQRQATG